MEDHKEIENEFLSGLLNKHKDAICPGAALLAGFVEAALSERETQAVESHISGCERCRETVKMLREEVEAPSQECGLNWERIEEKLSNGSPDRIRDQEPGNVISLDNAKGERKRTTGTSDIATDDVKSATDGKFREKRDRVTPPGKLFWLNAWRKPLSLAASVIIALFIITVIWLNAVKDNIGPYRGGSPSPSGGGGTKLSISVYGIEDEASVQISLSPGELPLASLNFDRDNPETSYSLSPGEYFVRVYGEKLESPWEKVEVKVAEKQSLSIKAEANTIVFSRGDINLSLRGAAFSCNIEGKEYTCEISDEALVLGPFKKGATLDNITIEKDGASYHYPGALKVKGGKQQIKVDLSDDSIRGKRKTRP